MMWKKRNQEIEKFLEKIEKIKGRNIDLSSGEDLSIAIMNLISIEEHLYFTAMKTDKISYIDMLNSVREIRKGLLKKIVKNPEGEEWCISKHLLAASMRLVEVGTKYLKEGERNESYKMFEDAFELYNLFWGLTLGIVKSEELKFDSKYFEHTPISLNGFGKLKYKISEIVKKMIDCCKE